VRGSSLVKVWDVDSCSLLGTLGGVGRHQRTKVYASHFKAMHAFVDEGGRPRVIVVDGAGLFRIVEPEEGEVLQR
jgi:hypothetical protein